MKQNKWIVAKFTLKGVTIPVERTIILPTEIMLFDMWAIIATAFDFEFDKTIMYVVNDVKIWMSVHQTDEGMFARLGVLFDRGITSLKVIYEGEDDWQVDIELSSTMEVPETLYCLEGTGQGILMPSFSHTDYENALKMIELGQQKQLLIDNPDINLFGKITDFDIEKFNNHLEYFATNLMESPYNNDEVEDEGENLLKGSALDYADSIDDPHQELIIFYEEIVGLNSEQAAYQVVYETTMNVVVSTMLEQGYTKETIEKTLMGTLAFEEKIYEQLEHELEILQSLPSRSEFFTDAEEEYLAEVEAVFMGILEERDLSLENYVHVDEDTATEIDEQFASELERIRQTHIS